MKEPFFTIDERIETLCRQAEEQCAGIFRQIDDTADYNARKVLAAFIKNRVSEPMFAGTTGYGYGDIGREALDAVLADIFGCEDALIRHNFVSGTHALTTALFGVLRPGDTIVSLTGRPYDTLEEVVGLRGEGHGSLKEWGVTFKMQELAPDGHIDFDAIPAAVQGARVAYIQRSRGYTLRPSVTVAEIARVVELVVVLSRATIDAGADMQEIFLFNNNYFHEIEQFQSLEELSVWLTGIMHRFISYSFDFTQVKHSDVVYKVMEYVKANFHRKISLDDVARTVYLSRSYLSSIFKEETGQSLFSYINKVRVEKSKLYLRDSGVALVDVAALCGFEDQSYFTKVFKKETGMSPKKYRDRK